MTTEQSSATEHDAAAVQDLSAVRRPAITAAVLAFSSAAVSLYWAVGGRELLDTVGGAIEDLARQGGATATLLAVGAAGAKVIAGALALALTARLGSRALRRVVLVLGVAGSALLMVYGGLLVLVGSLVLAGVVRTDAAPDLHALRWHVFVWDLWFLVWGIAWAVAVYRRLRRNAPRRPHV